MKNKNIQHVNSGTGFLPLVLGGLITLGLFLLGYFKALHLDLEVVLAPFIVINILAYGDKLLIIIFLFPISLFSKAIRKINTHVKNNN